MVLFPCSGCSCPCGWIGSNSLCYFMNGSSEEQWDDAREMCRAMDADLAVITSETQNDFLYGLINWKKQDSWFGTWIGLERNATDENKFYWVDGTPLSGQYSNWASGEPSNNAEKCGLFWGPTASQPNKWNDAYCDFSIRVSQGSPKPLVLCQKAAESD